MAAMPGTGARGSDDAAASPPPWWQTAVVYQVYPRSFADGNGDGVGDLPGIAARLDHLVDLGVDAVWISPFYPSPMADFGYDVADFCDVDPLFGTLADFDALLAAAHRRGLRVLVDWVPNHTSREHPWFRASRSCRTDPKRSWYVWRDPAPGGGPPNNWLATFGGAAWTLDEGTGQYYLHSFLPEQPDLNWREPDVRRAMLETLEFWLRRGVDGFRIDCALAVMKDPELRDNPPAPPDALGMHKDMGAWRSQLHVHDRAHEDAHGVYREVRALLERRSTPGRERVAIGEMHVFDPREFVRWYGAGLDELHLPFNFGLLATPWRADAVRACVEAMEAALPHGTWPSWVLGNHDEDRVATRVGPENARAAMALLLTLRGTPTIYQGDELGLLNVPVPDDEAQDPWGKRVPGMGLGRDVARTPMAWDGGPNAGFAAAGARPWLPLHADAATRNVEVQSRDPRSMLALTRALLQLRRARPALHRGSYRTLGTAPEGVFAFAREHGRERLVVAISFVDAPRRVELGAGGARVLLSTRGERSLGPGGGELELRPREAVVLEALQ